MTETIKDKIKQFKKSKNKNTGDFNSDENEFKKVSTLGLTW